MTALFSSTTDNHALSRKDRKKLSLIWLEQNDFSKLEENKAALEDVWNTMLKEIKPYFADYKLQFPTVIQHLSKITITSDMRFPCYYCPSKNSFTFELASFFFIGNAAKTEFATVTLPWLNAGRIMHELDHYFFFHERNMIMREERVYEEFERTHPFEAEIHARLAQIDFLKNCRYTIPDTTTSFNIKIVEWFENGKDFKHKFEQVRLSKASVFSMIDTAIADASAEVSQIKGGKYEEAVKESVLLIKILAKALLLPTLPSQQPNTLPIELRIFDPN